MPFYGSINGHSDVPGTFAISGPPNTRQIGDDAFALTVWPDPLLEQLPGDVLYRHAPTGVICGADARLVPNTALDEENPGPAATIADAYLKFGTEFPSHILGEFAAAIWDPRDRCLVLVADRAASRGIYYRRHGEAIAFATDVRLLRNRYGLRPDVEQFSAWLCDPIGSALVAGGDFRLVPAGHVAIARNGGLDVRRYWSPENAPDIRYRKDDEYVDAAESLVQEAVRCRLPRRLRIGSHLSGGLDSTIIAGTAARLLSDRGQKLPTFTFAHTAPDIAAQWTGEYWDEHLAARKFAGVFSNIEPIEVSSDAPGPFDGLESFLSATGELCLSGLPLWATRYATAAQAQKQGIAVLLMGVAGNETVSQGGVEMLAPMLQRRRIKPLFRAWAGLAGQGTSTAKIAGHTLLPFLPDGIRMWLRQLAGVPEARSWASQAPLAAELRAGAVAAETASTYSRLEPSRSLAKKLSHLSWASVFAWYRHGFGMDVRAPFLDSRIVEFCAGLPPEQFLGGGETRHLARRLLRRLGAPPEVTCEIRCGVQHANWHRQMMRGRKALYAELEALEGNATASRLLDLKEMRHILDELPKARPAKASDITRFNNRLSIGMAVGRLALHMEGSNAGPPLDGFPEKAANGGNPSPKKSQPNPTGDTHD